LHAYQCLLISSLFLPSNATLFLCLPLSVSHTFRLSLVVVSPCSRSCLSMLYANATRANDVNTRPRATSAPRDVFITVDIITARSLSDSLFPATIISRHFPATRSHVAFNGPPARTHARTRHLRQSDSNTHVNLESIFLARIAVLYVDAAYCYRRLSVGLSRS